MIIRLLLDRKALLILFFLLAVSQMRSQCDLVITNPPCQSGPVNITAASVTAGSANIGTLTYWTNPNATVALANPAAVAQSGVYYIKNTSGACTDIQPVYVTIGTVAPNATPFLHVECTSSNTTANSIFFDFNEVGQTSFTWSYTVNGGPPISGSQLAPTSHVVNGLVPGDKVIYTIVFVGVCTPPIQITAYPERDPDFANNTTKCVGETLPTVAPNGVIGTWNHPQVTANTSNYTFTPLRCQNPQIISITGIPRTIPTFNIPSVCQGSTAPVLPPNSNNIPPISGTWSPATINTATVGTTNYTFTPNAALFPCADPVIKPITITAPSGNPTFPFANNVALCDGATTGVPVLTNVSTNGITGTWSAPVVSNTADGVYTFTPTPGQCANNFVLNVDVRQNATIQFNSPFDADFSLCVGSTLTLPTVDQNGIVGTWSPSTINTSVPATITYTFTANSGQCVTTPTYSIDITVTPKATPSFDPILPFCEDSAPPQGLALPPVSLNNIIGSWNPANIDNTQTRQYTFTPAQNQCAFPLTITITVIQKVTPTFPPVAPFCAGTPAPVLPLASNNPTPITGTWSPAAVDNTQGLDYTFTPDAGQCAEIKIIHIEPDQPIDPDFEDIEFCEGTPPPSLGTVSPNQISGTWLPAVIDPTIPFASYTFTPDADECANPKTINVTVNPLIDNSATWTVSSYFTDGVVVITPTEAGDHLYQLDNGPIQASNTFTHVSPGLHSFTVYDTNNCSPANTQTDVIQIIGYPKFFTPNGDAYFDNWNIFDLNELAQQPYASIFIFDRYGKLLKQIVPAGEGWDGTYNGQPMPSSDYWFLVKYFELGVPREFKAHFSLKR